MAEKKSANFYTKEWYLAFDDSKEGPFSIAELRNDFRLTPDTLVWKDGFTAWIPIRFVSELKEVFEDAEESGDETKTIKPTFKLSPSEEQMAITMGHESPPYLWWGLIVAIAIILLVYIYVSK